MTRRRGSGEDSIYGTATVGAARFRSGTTRMATGFARRCRAALAPRPQRNSASSAGRWTMALFQMTSLRFAHSSIAG